MTERRSAVGIYDRPHPLRQRRVWMPLAIIGATLAFWLAVWWMT